MEEQTDKQEEDIAVSQRWCIIGKSYFTFSSVCSACECDPCDCHWGTNEIKEE